MEIPFCKESLRKPYRRGIDLHNLLQKYYKNM